MILELVLGFWSKDFEPFDVYLASWPKSQQFLGHRLTAARIMTISLRRLIIMSVGLPLWEHTHTAKGTKETHNGELE